MKTNLFKGAALTLLAAGACLITGCSNTEVAELTTSSTYGCEAGAGIEKVEAVGSLEAIEPVGEECTVGAPLTITTPRDRYFDPMTRSWERPYPFGPYGTANWR